MSETTPLESANNHMTEQDDLNNIQFLLQSETVDSENTRIKVFERVLQLYIDNSTTDLMKQINNFTFEYVKDYGKPQKIPQRRYTLVLAMILHALSSKQYLPILPELHGMTFEEQNKRVANTFNTLYINNTNKGITIDHHDGTLSLLTLQTPQDLDIERVPSTGPPLTLPYTRVSDLPDLFAEFLSPVISI